MRKIYYLHTNNTFDEKWYFVKDNKFSTIYKYYNEKKMTNTVCEVGFFRIDERYEIELIEDNSISELYSIELNSFNELYNKYNQHTIEIHYCY